MKFSLVIILLMGFFHVKGQDSLLGGIFPMENGEVTYSDQISMDSLNKDEIFSVVREWAARAYAVRAYPFRQVGEEDKGSQIFNGYVPFLDTSQGGVRAFRIYYTIKFFIEDELVKVVITDLQLEYSSLLHIAGGRHKFEDLLTPAQYVLPKKEKKSINFSSKADPNHVNSFVGAMLNSIGRHLGMIKKNWVPQIKMEQR